MDEALDPLLDLHEGAEVEHLDHLGLDDLADRVVVGDAIPRIGDQLLDAERHLGLLAVEVDVEDDRLDLVPLLIELRRVLDPLGPRQVGDVHQAVDALFDLHEDPEVGDVADDALDDRSRRVLLLERGERVRLELLDAEADAVLARVDVEHDRLDGVTDGHHLGRVLDPAGPGHLGDVDQALDPLLELDERAVVLERDDLAAHHGAGRVLLLGVRPGILADLLEAEGDALGLGVELEDLDPHVIADLEQLRGVRDASPGHVGDVQEAVDAAEVDEGAVLGEVLDDPLDDLAFLELLEGHPLQLGALLLQEHAARQHDVAALLVELDDLEAVRLADEGVEVAHRAQVDLRARQERLHAAADGDREAALHARADGSFDQLVALAGARDLVPNLEAIRLLLRQNAEAVLVLAALEEDVDLVAFLDANRAVGLRELVEGDRSFGLVTNVDDHVVLADVDDLALDDVAFFDVFVLEGLFEQCCEALLL